MIKNVNKIINDTRLSTFLVDDVVTMSVRRPASWPAVARRTHWQGPEVTLALLWSSLKSMTSYRTACTWRQKPSSLKRKELN